jgi:para-aminobenzoate synthetase component 1
MNAPKCLPVVEELLPLADVESVFIQLSKQPHCLFLDSAKRQDELGRYSFIAADPFDYLEIASHAENEIDVLQQHWNMLLQDLEIQTIDELPPFQGGVAGMFSYDIGASLENIPQPRCNEFQMPSLALGFYDTVVAFDHHQNRAWIISQGLPEKDPAARATRASTRIAQFRSWIADQSPRAQQIPVEGIDETSLAAQFPVSAKGVEDGRLTSNMSAEEYLEIAQKTVDYIHAGDIFQVNLSQRLLCRATTDAVSLYQRLRQRNAATFAGYFAMTEFEIASASPERFLQVTQGVVEARPIKGTRARIAMPEADLYAAADLQQSEKDRAENVMIVDLLRNDISRVCEPDSVFVTDLCRLEVYETVQHLVSVVQGRLRSDANVFDLLRASFPGGSITGAPKVRAMELIAELEPTARGAYCGSLGYIGFNGDMDLSILIRTITAGKGWWQFPVGGGIVAQSNPQREYAETWEKAVGMLRALE